MDMLRYKDDKYVWSSMILNRRPTEEEFDRVEMPVPEPLAQADIGNIRLIYFDLLIYSKSYGKCLHFSKDAISLEKEGKHTVILNDMDLPKDVFKLLSEIDFPFVRVYSVSDFIKELQEEGMFYEGAEEVLKELLDKAYKANELALETLVLEVG